MQISIDTSRDSKEDILKAIQLLHSIIGEGHVSTPSRSVFDIPQAASAPQGSVFGNFFDSMDKTQAVVSPAPLAKKDSSPKVELY